MIRKLFCTPKSKLFITAFFNVELQEGNRIGELVEYNTTPVIFNHPAKEITYQYVTVVLDDF
ncbi:hypothetical protein VB735_24960 [Halotia wernerae UHCC 0503]|nr:hypothetical protein [Halotia wernerae UHCC 0503]